ncbi:uncharacterized protein LOC111863878 [Cryptotermes secundus]|uniref:uncharacterized protein LOC111863878 n=1 Tax=Cryptotermes secundus TaxID=105785 RepID=UPI000CD7D596|nr:uncharacterized protein LOC111863878 [Cryptotermes secundus]XP_033607146.1 uncharacterized protein LOC111863878 [Cryptotermes secundus]XP_033607147.1 uncharacterized protein LOC111863878 [Cryptotermes secundus]XP_033607148.1 uncharacterized protein LOC111863878 [Cryptotermes secundus]
MLHRAPSRRRTAFRSTGVSSTSSAQTGSVSSCSSRGRINTNVTGRKVGVLDTRSPTEGSENWTSTPTRGPRCSVGGGDVVPYTNRSPRNSLVPENKRTNPRSSPVPECDPSPRNSPVPEYDPSPRNSPVPEYDPSPRNSPVPEYDPSPRNSPVLEYDPSPRHSPVLEYDPSSRSSPVLECDPSPRNSPVPEYNLGPRNSLVPDSNRNSRSSLVPDSCRSPRNSLVPDPTKGSRSSLVLDSCRSPRNSLVPDPNRSPRSSLVPDSCRSPRKSSVPDPSRSPRSSLVSDPYRSPRNSSVPDLNRGPRSSLASDPYRSPRNSSVPDPNRGPRSSLVPDPYRSPRNSLIPDSNRSRRRSLAPDFNRSPRSSLVSGSTRNQRNSLIPEAFDRCPRGSLVPDGGSSRRSPRGSIASASGVVEAAFDRAVTFMETEQPGTSRGTRSLSPYRMSVSARGAQMNFGYSGGMESRRASSNVSQVSSDDRRHLFERSRLSSDVGLSEYGSFVYQLNDAHVEASGSCDFMCRALQIVYKTVVVTVILMCLTALPLFMLIMGVQFLRDCPVEPQIPVYMLVGGSFGTLKMLWLLWRQISSRRYELLDLTAQVSNLDDGTLVPSAGTRMLSTALSLFLVVWFALGNYWVLHVAWPDFEPTLFEPNKWCHKTLYLFALVHFIVIYSVFALVGIVAIILLYCYLLKCPVLTRYK